jgi:hypothetical protein
LSELAAFAYSSPWNCNTAAACAHVHAQLAFVQTQLPLIFFKGFTVHGKTIYTSIGFHVYHL